MIAPHTLAVSKGWVEAFSLFPVCKALDVSNGAQELVCPSLICQHMCWCKGLCFGANFHLLPPSGTCKLRI